MFHSSRVTCTYPQWILNPRQKEEFVLTELPGNEVSEGLTSKHMQKFSKLQI